MTLHDLKTLVLSLHPLVALETVEEERVQELLAAAAADLRMPLFHWSLTRGLCRLPDGAPAHGTADPLGLVRHLDTLSIEGLFHLKDFGPHLADRAVARGLREALQRFGRTRSTLVLSGATIELPKEFAHKAVHGHLQLPTREELLEVFRTLLHSLRQTRPVNVSLEPGDLDAMVRALAGLTRNQARQALAYVMLEDGRLAPDDVPKLVERKTRLIRDAGLLEFFPAADNRFELGGFDRLKAWLARARLGFAPEAQALNLPPPRGVLIAGVQGCGKSLAARVIAREWQVPLLKLDAGRLYDKYIGETEKNFRKATALAESLAPCVLWIDEIEKGFGTGGGDSDGGLSRRVLGSLLTWLQEKRHPVFVAATANDVFSLPPELLRKGRFDEIFFVDLPTQRERMEILAIHLRLRKQEPDGFELPRLAAASEGFSGAELEQAVVSSLYRALQEGRPPSTGLLLEEIAATQPLSHVRREDVARLRALAAERFVPVA
jgi:hypothetical protein